MLVYDVTRKETFKNLPNWATDVANYTDGTTPLVIVTCCFFKLFNNIITTWFVICFFLRLQGVKKKTNQQPLRK